MDSEWCNNGEDRYWTSNKVEKRVHCVHVRVCFRAIESCEKKSQAREMHIKVLSISQQQLERVRKIERIQPF